MKVSELLLEISASEKKRLKRAAADAKRADAAAAERAEQEELARKIAKRTQKKLSKLNQPISATKSQQSAQSSSPFGDPELEKYMIDPTIDTTFEGGYYLQFEKNGNNITAYWSKNPDYTAQQMQRFNQTAALNPKFDEGQIAGLIKTLVDRTKTAAGPGYVNIVIPKEYASDWALMDKNNYFRKLLEYLAREYPHDEYSADPSVNWEIA